MQKSEMKNGLDNGPAKPVPKPLNPASRGKGVFSCSLPQQCCRKQPKVFMGKKWDVSKGMASSPSDPTLLVTASGKKRPSQQTPCSSSAEHSIRSRDSADGGACSPDS